MKYYHFRNNNTLETLDIRMDGNTLPSAHHRAINFWYDSDPSNIVYTGHDDDTIPDDKTLFLMRLDNIAQLLAGCTHCDDEWVDSYDPNTDADHNIAYGAWTSFCRVFSFDTTYGTRMGTIAETMFDNDPDECYALALFYEKVADRYHVHLDRD